MLPVSWSKGTLARTVWGILLCWFHRNKRRVLRAAKAINQTLVRRSVKRFGRVIYLREDFCLGEHAPILAQLGAGKNAFSGRAEPGRVRGGGAPGGAWRCSERCGRSWFRWPEPWLRCRRSPSDPHRWY